MLRGHHHVICVFEPLVQLCMLVGRNDLKILNTRDAQSLVLQQVQGGGMNELVGPRAGLGSALPPDEGSADMVFGAFVLEVAVPVEGVTTFVVQQTDLR